MTLDVHPFPVLRRRAAPAAAALSFLAAIFLAAQGAAQVAGPQLYPRQQAQVRQPANSTTDMWDAQPRLIAQSLARIPARAEGANIYTVAIAPISRQNLFSREAKAMLKALAENYGGTAQGGVLLSNSALDTQIAPLATKQNIAQVFAAIGQAARPDKGDIVIVYLTSHGAPDATLESGLPRNLPMSAVSASSLAEALDAARIQRRVIIISACFAGSWIPRLANDDTIVITAAAADRTSFGCAEDRQLTYFGEAFLTGPFARGASLHASFDGAKQTVTKWENEEQVLNSMPQAYIGKNMAAFWDAAAGAGSAQPKAVAARP